MDPTVTLYARRMALVIGVVALLLVVGAIVLYRSAQAGSFALGVAMTAGTHVAKLYWLRHTVAVAAMLDAPTAASYTQARYLMRFFLTIAVLVLAGVLSQTEIFGVPLMLGAALGLLTMPIAGYAMHFFIKRDIKKEAQSN